MSCEERKHCILSAVRKVFSRKGLEGATTRELAKEAGVSEALLYLHYPSKEALYAAMLTHNVEAWLGPMKEKIHKLKPSTSTLVISIYVLVSKLLSPHPEDVKALLRLYLRSLAEDGKFAKSLTLSEVAPQVLRIKESIEAAIKAGDIEKSKAMPFVQSWFIDRLLLIIGCDLLPPVPVVDYSVPRDKLIEQVVLFVLHGLGLKEEAIRHHYDPEGFALLAG
jgi:AcrR family transcriptional regulator